jgi:heme-degrading monooxygenase HmoA
MITELAILTIDPDNAEDFEKTYQDVVHILRRQPGYLADKLMRAIERPEEYILAVEWESVADHENFIAAADYPDLDGALGEYVLEANVAHFNTLFLSD